MTDSLGQSQVLPYLFGLAKKGCTIHLISFEKPERNEDIPTIQRLCDDNGILWHPLDYTKNPPLISTLKDVSSMYKYAKKLNKNINFDIVHCRSYISALVGRKLQKNYGLKFIFDMRGFWADERIEGGIWNKKNPIFNLVYRYFKKKEIEFLNTADAVVSLTEAGKKEIESWDNFVSKKEIEVIPCCVDVDRFDRNKIPKEETIRIKQGLGIAENDFVLGYIGSIGTWYMLEEMLDFYSVYRKSNANTRFFFLSGESETIVKKKALERGIPTEEIIVKRVMHSEVPKYITVFDFSIFFIRPTFSKTASSPTKQGELMAMGLPILCNAGVGDTDLIIEKYNSGVVLGKLNEEMFLNCELKKTDFQAPQIRSGALEWYNLSKGVEKYYKIYLEVL